MEADVVILSAVGARLRSERERLRLNQEDFGSLAGVTRNSQQTYEAGRRPFSVSYLLELVQHGIDPVFILTGERSAKGLADEQARLLDAFETMDPAARDALLKLASAAAGLPLPNREERLPDTAALTEAFDELLEQSPGLAGADLAHELAKRLPIILRAAAGGIASSSSEPRDAADAPRSSHGADRHAGRPAQRI